MFDPTHEHDANTTRVFAGQCWAFDTPYKGGFLVFGVPNAKYLAFGTPNSDALRDNSS